MTVCTQLPYALKSLNDVIAQIDAEIVGEPAFRLVVTGTGAVLVTDDGACPLTRGQDCRRPRPPIEVICANDRAKRLPRPVDPCGERRLLREQVV
jgi:hypothetical protein